MIDIENLPTGNQFGDNGTVKSVTPSTDGSNTHPTSDSSQTTSGISTLMGESDRGKLSTILQSTSDSIIADILKRLTQTSESPNSDTTEGNQPLQE